MLWRLNVPEITCSDSWAYGCRSPIPASMWWRRISSSDVSHAIVIGGCDISRMTGNVWHRRLGSAQRRHRERGSKFVVCRWFRWRRRRIASRIIFPHDVNRIIIRVISTCKTIDKYLSVLTNLEQMNFRQLTFVGWKESTFNKSAILGSEGSASTIVFGNKITNGNTLEPLSFEICSGLWRQWRSWPDTGLGRRS